MKRRVQLYQAFLLLIVIASFSSCKKDSLGDCFTSTGGNATETRPVADFTSIYVYNNPDVIISQDTVNSVVVIAGDHLMSGIKTTVAGSQLTIENDNICNWVRSYKRKIVIDVHVKNLNRVDHYGSGDITSANTLVADSFQTNNWASGNVTLSLNVQHAFARTHVAAGDVTYSGTAGDVFIYDICQGIIHCENLQANSAVVVSKGTGDCYANATSTLSSELRGEGYVYYYGNPVITQNINTGSGQLVHVQ